MYAIVRVTAPYGQLAPLAAPSRPAWSKGAPTNSFRELCARASIGRHRGRERAMSAIGWRLLGVILAYVLQTALLCAALPANPDEAPARSSLAGQLLVAAPSMGDPHFERTVILIVKHDPDGAVGIVINKPIGETSIASVFEALGQKGGDVTGDVRVFSGGPVQPEVGFVVHSADYNRPETIAVNDRVSMTSSLDILRVISAKKGPTKILVAFGYAGWGPDQLEREIELRAWGTAEADPTLIFDEDRDKVWDHAWERRTQHF
jgi:putative transcriptional regulator